MLNKFYVDFERKNLRNFDVMLMNNHTLNSVCEIKKNQPLK